MTQLIQSRIVCNFCGESVDYEYSMDRSISLDEFTEITGFVHSAIAIPHDKRDELTGVFVDVHACKNPICRRELKAMPELPDYGVKE